MKKLFLLLAVVASSCVSLFASSKPQAPIRQAWNNEIALYGDVESVTVTSYFRINEDGTIDENDCGLKVSYSFNENGDVKECCIYEFNGSLSEKYIHEYDLNNKLLFVIHYNVNGTLYSKTRYLCKYDKQRNMVEKIKYNGNSPIPSEITKYEIVYREQF